MTAQTESPAAPQKYGKGHRRIDLARMREMYDQGMGDGVIAEHFHVTRVAVRLARCRMGLRSHQWGQQAKKPKPPKPPPTSERVSSPAAVLIWLRLNGHEATRVPFKPRCFMLDGDHLSSHKDLVARANKLRVAKGLLPFRLRAKT